MEFENDINFFTVKAENRQFEEALAFLCEVQRLYFGKSGKTLKKIQIAGTNGKGSTGAYLSSILMQAGYKVGFYTSPSLVCVNERIRINDRMITDDELVSYIPVITQAQINIGRKFGGFERITAASMLYYIDNDVDIAVMETGLGGRFDTVSAVDDTILASITSIGMDHMVMLGDTISQIASEKCGIMRKNVPVVSHTQVCDAEKVVKDTAKELDCPLTFISDCTMRVISSDFYGQHLSIEYGGIVYDVKIPLAGEYQRQNAENALICAVKLSEMGYKISKTDVEKGFAETKWSGRLQSVTVPGIDKKIILDGAHNPHAMKALADFVTGNTDKKYTALISVMHDKDISGVLDEMSRFADKAVCVKITLRSEEPCVLCEKAKEKGIEAYVADSVMQGLELADKISDGDAIFAIGSLYLVGDILSVVNKK